MIAPRWGRLEAGVGAIAAVLIIALTTRSPVWVGYLALWIPLTAAVVVAVQRRTAVSDDDEISRIRFRVTWMDVLVGAFVGLLLRTLIILIEVLGVGHVTSSSSMFEVDHDLLWVATAIIAPIVIAPIIEECFFRGLVLPAIGTNWMGLVGSALLFCMFHLIGAFHPLTAVSTFIVGLVLGALAMKTKRLGAGIVAHVVYNATLIAMSELGA